MLPLVFFAAHGAFSFQQGNSAGGFSPGLVATRDPGVLGYALAAITYCVVAWLIKSELRGVLLFAAHFKMLTLLTLLTVSSVIWSRDPMYSASRGVFYLVGTLFAYYLVIRFQPEEIMTLVSRLGILVCLLGLIMVVFLPQFGLNHGDPRNAVGWQGIFGNRTAAAKCLVFLLSPALVSRGKRSKVGRILYVLLVTLMIAMAHSSN